MNTRWRIRRRICQCDSNSECGNYEWQVTSPNGYEVAAYMDWDTALLVANHLASAQLQIVDR